MVALVPAAKVPTGQGTQSLVPAPSAKVPATQALPAAEAPTTGTAVPAAAAVHEVAAAPAA